MINIPSQWVNAPQNAPATPAITGPVTNKGMTSQGRGSYRNMTGNRGRQVRTSRQKPMVSLVDAGIAASWLGLILAIVV